MAQLTPAHFGLTATNKRLRDLNKQMQENMYYGANKENEMELRNQQARLSGEQADMYRPKTEAEMRNRNSQSNLYDEQADMYRPKTREEIRRSEAERRLIFAGKIPQAKGRASAAEQEARILDMIAGGGDGRQGGYEPSGTSLGSMNNQQGFSPLQAPPRQGPNQYSTLDQLQKGGQGNVFDRERAMMQEPGLTGEMQAEQEVPVQQFQGQEQEGSPGQQREQPPLTMQELQALKDNYTGFKAMQRGRADPSREAENAGKKEQAILDVRGKDDLLKKYAEESRSAAESLPVLDSLAASLDALPPWMANDVVPNFMKKWANNKDFQVAMKSGSQLMLGQLRTLFPGRVLVSELEMLRAGTPNANMTHAAQKEVVAQARWANKAMHVRNQMGQKLKNITKDAAEIDSIVAMAARSVLTADKNKTYPEKVKLWNKFATPEAVQALREGNDNYIPKDIPLKSLSEAGLIARRESLRERGV